MSSNTDYARLKRLANRAEELLCDANFKEIITDIKHDLVREWANTPSDATTRREELYRDALAVGRLETYLKAYGETLRLQDRIDGR